MYSMWINSIIDMIFTGNLCILFFLFSGMCSNIIIYVLYALLVLKHFNFNLFNLYLTRRDSEIKISFTGVFWPKWTAIHQFHHKILQHRQTRGHLKKTVTCH